MDLGSSPRRRLFTAAGLLTMVVLLLVLGVALSRSPDAQTPVSQDDPGQVLLVPGYGGDTSVLLVLAARLRAAGRTAVVVSLPAEGTGDLRDQAKALDDAVEAALKSTGEGSVDLVGYSAGGVVIRWWVVNDAGAGKARRIVTLGSPHHGTALASTAASLLGSDCGAACQQLRPGSPLLSELNAGDETPRGPLWTTVWTSDDETVTPPVSGILTGALNLQVQQVCRGTTISHEQLPRDPLVVGLVLQALASGQPPATDGSACSALRAAGS